MDNFTSLTIPLNESAQGIQTFRSRHVHRPAAAVPPHISILYPFYPLEKITEFVDRKITECVSKHLPISYSLEQFEIFADAEVLYLKPEPDAPFVSLYEDLRMAFPDLKSVFDPPTMHLTIAHAEPAMGMDDLKHEFLTLENIALPVPATANKLELYEKKMGVWAKISEYTGQRDVP